ncbi:MAG TPA: ATP-dependent 6-phosphofructokinase [Nitrospirota bacterium]|nr:ATP-dependent 6-phosphofructokinase [Nitrospirota bacterium]
MMRIGVLSGGGDAPGLNAVIRAVAKTAIFKHGWEVTGIIDGFEGLLTPTKTRQLTSWNTRGILSIGGTILGTTNRGNPFAHKTVVSGKEIVEDMSSEVVKNIRELGLDVLVVIGGDGSLKIGQRLQKMGIVPVIGVPKTIDNDLMATHVTFGFQTAVDTATEALDKLHTTAESHQRVIVLEVMGRYAGWIALEAGIAGSADVILVPEIPFRIDKVTEKLIERKKAGSKSSIVVVAEGAKPAGGEMAVREKASDGYVLRLGGMGEIVANEISKRTSFETRVTVLGHVQRGGSPCPFDRLLATRYGAAAVELIAQKKFGEMVSYQPPLITSVPLEQAISSLKLVEPNSELVMIAEGMGVSFGR